MTEYNIFEIVRSEKKNLSSVHFKWPVADFISIMLYKLSISSIGSLCGKSLMICSFEICGSDLSIIFFLETP